MNNIPSLPKAQIALERSLAKGNHTLGSLRKLEDEASLRTDQIGQQVFAQIEQQRTGLIGRKVARLERKNDLLSQIRILELLNSSLAPDEMKVALRSLKSRMTREEGSSALAAAVKERLEDLEFLVRYPVISEVVKNPEYSNYYTRLQRIAQEGMKQYSYEMLQKSITPLQLREILHYAAREA